MADYKFGQITEEEKQEDESVDQPQEYKFGKLTDAYQEKDQQEKSILQKTPQYLKQGGINLFDISRGIYKQP